MSVEAERETLERKDRDELQKIAGALGGKVTSRTRKADIIDQILELTGVTGDDGGSDAKDAGSGDGDSNDAAAKSSDAKEAGGDQDEAKGQQSKGQQSKGQQSKGQQSKAQQSKGSQGRGGQGGDDATGDDEADDAKGADKDSASGEDSSGDQNGNDDGDGGRRRRRRGRNRDGGNQQDEYTGEPIPVAGILDLRDDGYGFLRVDGLLPSKDDCYVSVKQVRQFGLRKGDLVAGGSRPAFRNEKNPAILKIDTVNDVELEPGAERPRFEELPVSFPSEQLALSEGDESTTTARALDLLAPFGKGSRVLVAAPPRSGATTVLQTVARSIEADQPDVKLVVVLLDERPEEIAEMEDLVVGGTVHGSAFDADPEEHVAVAELALERARRLAEAGDDVVVLLDGLTALAKADHAAPPGNNNKSAQGIDVSAVHAAKRAFGAGRALTDAGSITLVATAAVETDAAVDAAVFDAVAPAATTQIRLDRAAAERRSFPALDVGRTGTRREELLVGEEGAAQRDALRRLLAGKPDGEDAAHADSLDTLLSRLRETPSNDDLLAAAAKEETS